MSPWKHELEEQPFFLICVCAENKFFACGMVVVFFFSACSKCFMFLCICCFFDKNVFAFIPSLWFFTHSHTPSEMSVSLQDAMNTKVEVKMSWLNVIPSSSLSCWYVIVLLSHLWIPRVFGSSCVRYTACPKGACSDLMEYSQQCHTRLRIGLNKNNLYC